MGKAKKTGSLIFEAVKYKYVDDEDGEALLSLRVSMKHKLSAFAIPTKKLLRITVNILR